MTPSPQPDPSGVPLPPLPAAATRGEPGYVWRSGQARRLAMIRRWADLSGRVLDNGCGLGTYLEALAPYSQQRHGLEVELDRAARALPRATGVVQAVGERLPFASASFDFILSNEVIEHVDDDGQALAEMIRALKPGGRLALFCPNRWYPVEQHGIFWRGRYRFGNIPLVNYLPRGLRNRLAPHVRTYTRRDLHRLFTHQPIQVIHYTRIFGGYDNIEARWPRLGRWLKKALYAAERTPLRTLGISHFVVLERV
ncbi:MAG: methyltransferase domain-containing protein [Candidatus Promineifilaceae bacterium]|nr:methyltransferase domain-containing protein [Candidatus Promineifilaceae bacterium]